MAPHDRISAPERRAALLVAVAAATFAACGASGGAGHNAPDGATDGAAEGAPTPSCADYCATIQAACTTDHQQYSSTEDCLASCLAFPVGQVGDLRGDTLGCRVTFAREAAAHTDTPALHCTHAGPGGDGVCGDNCVGFCDIAMLYCTAANDAKIYDTRADCLADCATHHTDMKLDTGDGPRTDLGNEVACVLYHAQMASTAPNAHCRGDLATTSGTCR
jgi:hypothetical protein